MVFESAWLTNHLLSQSNVAVLASSGRARWKIENENNNTLKNHGYHLEHNFGHSKKNLSNLLLAMNLLAFLTHTVLGWLDQRYAVVRASLSSCKKFFNDLRALLTYRLHELHILGAFDGVHAARDQNQKTLGTEFLGRWVRWVLN